VGGDDLQAMDGNLLTEIGFQVHRSGGIGRRDEPDKISELSEHNIDDLFKNANVRTLYGELHRLIEKIDSAVWRKVGSQSAR
jgi:hypothetical protein